MAQGLEDPQLVFAAEVLAYFLGSYTERLEEARSLLQKALEVSMVSVTFLCCRVLLARPAAELFRGEHFNVTLPHPCLRGLGGIKLTLAVVSPSAWRPTDRLKSHSKARRNAWQGVHLASSQSSLPCKVVCGQERLGRSPSLVAHNVQQNVIRAAAEEAQVHRQLHCALTDAAG